MAFLIVCGNEGMDQQGDIFPPFPQGRNLQFHGSQPIKQVGTDLFFFQCLLGRTVHVGEDPDIYRMFCQAADSPHGPFLEDPEQFNKTILNFVENYTWT